jgi:acylphosphatase
LTLLILGGIIARRFGWSARYMVATTARLQATVRGIVQGVNFRFYTRQQAMALRLTGRVANRPDGNVEVVAEGPRAALDQLLAFLQQGPSMARVDDVQYDFLPATREFDEFQIDA